MNQLVQKFKDVARYAKKERWNKFCTNIHKDKSLNEFWKLHKSMNRKDTTASVKIIKLDDGQKLNSDEERGSAFLKRYLEQTDQKNLQERLATKNKLDTLRASSSTDITFDGEMIKQFLALSKNSAPGPDQVDYDRLRELSDKDLEKVAELYNQSYIRGEVPEDWLHSYLAVLPKPGKDPEKLNGYRIITMQNTIGKLMEKIVASRLASDLENKNLLPPTLGSYRKKKDIWANAAIFAYDTYEAFQQKEDTVAVALDLEDAYNRVTYERLMQILEDSGINSYMINWLASALMQRTVALRLGTWTSDPVTITPGLPQGSPLSPVLYNIYTARVAAISVPKGRTLTFADDVLVYVSGKDKDVMTDTMHTVLADVEHWCEESNSIINPAKAAVLWCSLDNTFKNIKI